MYEKNMSRILNNIQIEDILPANINSTELGVISGGIKGNYKELKENCPKRREEKRGRPTRKNAEHLLPSALRRTRRW